MMAVAVETAGETITPGMERGLAQPEFDALISWDIAPDGERFVVVGRLAAAGSILDPTVTNTTPNRVEVRVPEIRVVTGLFEELRNSR